MHRCGPEKPESKYFVYTGTKKQFPNYSMYFIDWTKTPKTEMLKGINQEGLVLPLTDFGSNVCCHSIPGSTFPYDNCGIVSVGDGYFYVADTFENTEGQGGLITLYQFNRETLTFEKV